MPISEETEQLKTKPNQPNHVVKLDTTNYNSPMRYLFLTLFLALQLVTHAQLSKEIDSINLLLAKDKREDTLRLQRMDNIIWRFRFMDSLKMARGMALKTVALCDKITSGEPKEEIRNQVLRIKADCYLEMAETYKAGNEQYSYYIKALKVFRECKDTTDICEVLRAQEEFCANMEYYDKAVEIGTERIKLSIAQKDTGEILQGLLDVSHSLFLAKRYEQAIEHARPCFSYQSTKGWRTWWRDDLYRNLAESFSAVKNCDSALHYLNILLSDSTAGPKFFHAEREIWQAHIYLSCGDTVNYIAVLQKALLFFEGITCHTFASDACIALAKIYLAKGQMDKAQIFAGRASRHLDSLSGKTSEVMPLENGTISISTSLEENSEHLYRLLADIYTAKKDYQSAVKYERLNRVLNDTLMSRENAAKNIHLQEQFEMNREMEEQELKEAEAGRELQRQKYIRYGVTGGLGIVGIFFGVTFIQMRRVRKEKKRGDDLLLNILPAEIAEELKEKGKADAKQFDEVTVMFTDFVSFTKVSEKLSPQQLVDELHACFSGFDAIISKYNIEKIKTMGDGFIAAAGLPVANNTHAENMVTAAIEICRFMATRQQQNSLTFQIRIGIHSGPVVAGIVGVKKFAYDIWGDTVNTAARMEQNSEAGKINISQTTYELVKDKFNCKYRGEIEAKNKGLLRMYFVE